MISFKLILKRKQSFIKCFGQKFLKRDIPKQSKKLIQYNCNVRRTNFLPQHRMKLRFFHSSGDKI
jgi:hypothetical protein